jgi:hypothetical protein
LSTPGRSDHEFVIADMAPDALAILIRERSRRETRWNRPLSRNRTRTVA